VLPPADDKSATLGVDLVLGKECTPCAYLVGDVIRRLRHLDIVPGQTALLLSSAKAPCRYGQYHVLVRHILDEQGFSEVETIIPTAGDSYRGFGEHPTALRLLAWRGFVAADLLHALLLRHRPYERNPGETDSIYRQGLDRIVVAVRQGGGPLVRAMRAIGRDFRGLSVDRGASRPQIALVGEIFVRQHWPSNRNVIRRVEALGGEVILANVIEFLYYVNWWYIR
jgi:predicted nucleotide-binding protein (sugar kinase/HSP70/actin superfamily)